MKKKNRDKERDTYTIIYTYIPFEELLRALILQVKKGQKKMNQTGYQDIYIITNTSPTCQYKNIWGISNKGKYIKVYL